MNPHEAGDLRPGDDADPQQGEDPAKPDLPAALDALQRSASVERAQAQAAADLLDGLTAKHIDALTRLLDGFLEQQHVPRKAREEVISNVLLYAVVLLRRGLRANVGLLLSLASRRWKDLARRYARRDEGAQQPLDQELQNDAGEGRSRPLPRQLIDTLTPAEILGQREELTALYQAIGGLKDIYRDTLLLQLLEGLGPQAIAERLGIPVCTVKTRLHRAVEALRERLMRAGWNAA